MERTVCEPGRVRFPPAMFRVQYVGVRIVQMNGRQPAAVIIGLVVGAAVTTFPPGEDHPRRSMKWSLSALGIWKCFTN